MSALTLAQTYARIVTGRRARTSFLPVGPAPPLPPAAFPDAARRVLTAALATAPTGTAVALQPALGTAQARLRARRLVLGAFAKTGTPQLTFARFGPEDTVLDRAIARSSVALVDGRAWITDADAFERAVSAIGAARARRRLDVLNAAAARGDTPFRLGGNGGLVGLSTALQRLDGPARFGSTIALALAAYRPDAAGLELGPDGRAAHALAVPERAYVLVVQLQYGVETGEAVRASRALIPIVASLLEGA